MRFQSSAQGFLNALNTNLNNWFKIALCSCTEPYGLESLLNHWVWSGVACCTRDHTQLCLDSASYFSATLHHSCGKLLTSWEDYFPGCAYSLQQEGCDVLVVT